MRMKKLILTALSVLLVISMTACGNDVIIDVVTNDGASVESKGSDVASRPDSEGGSSSETGKTEDSGDSEGTGGAGLTAAGTKVIDVKDLKIGILYIGSADEASGYTYAHELGIQGMIANIGLSEDQVVRKENIDDGDVEAINAALKECVDEGCNVIFTTSWGYMEPTQKFAEEYPDIYFAHGTGYLSNGKNFTNYFGRIYQARYLSGIVAGLKSKSGKIGYVSAMGSDNSECAGGVDAFAMGVESVNPNAEIYVAVTNSWFDLEAEEKASRALVGVGCDVLSQHCDTTAPQVVSEENGTWAIGYNSDMSKETPNTTLTSVVWNWSAYYTSFVNSIVNGSYDGSNYYGGMEDSLVGLTDLASFCDDGTAARVEEAAKKIMTGEFGVFDGEMTTNDGQTVGTAGSTLDDATITGGINWYYHNVKTIDWN